MRMLRNKLKRNDGAAMIMTLCVMALFMVLGLSLLCGASQIVTNANKRMEQIQAEEIAYSLSHMLKDLIEKNDPDSEIGQTLQDFAKFYRSTALDGESRLTYTMEMEESELPEGCNGITLVLQKAFQMPTAGMDWRWLPVNEIQERYSGYFGMTVTVEMRRVSATIQTLYRAELPTEENDLKNMFYYRSDGTALYLDQASNTFYLNRTHTQPLTYRDQTGEIKYVTYSDALEQNEGMLDGRLQIYRCYPSDMDIPDYTFSYCGGT